MGRPWSALAALGVWPERHGARVVLLSPQGRVFRQAVAREYAQAPRLVLICGRYEGVDERVREHLVDQECSIGDFVLSGGEPAAAVVVDAVVRLLPGAVGSAASVEEDSHGRGLLDYPHYTRPPVYQGWEVPEVLRSGDHARIRLWRKRMAIEATLRKRPEMLEKARLDEEERRILGVRKEEDQCLSILHVQAVPTPPREESVCPPWVAKAMQTLQSSRVHSPRMFLSVPSGGKLFSQFLHETATLEQ